jgi:hypothetical protein
MDPKGIRPLGEDRFLVTSQRNDGIYAVELAFSSDERLVAANCDCPDFARPMTPEAAPTLHGIRVCKHILAAALRAKELQRVALTGSGKLPPVTATRRATNTSPSNTALPAPGQTRWDDEALEWFMRDEDDDVYWGDSPSQCMEHYREQMRRLVEHSRKSGLSIGELREFQARDRDWRERQRDERPY